MVASTDIKFFVHSNNNAPQLQNAYGSMIGVLDACLVNGISLGPVSTLTAVGTTVTAVFSTAHNLMQYQVFKITGANQAEYNGEHRILTVPNATSVTFQLATAPSATTATGTIITSLPPLGWEKPFSSTNEAGGGKAAYRSMNTLLPSRPYLRVVDELDPVWSANYAKYAKVGIVEEMTGIDTMLGTQAPYDMANPNKNWTGTGSGTTAFNGWAKWHYARGNPLANVTDTTAPVNGNRAWILVGSKDYFYILGNHEPSSAVKIAYGFGCFESYIPADNACTFLAGTVLYSTGSSSNGLSSNTSITGAGAKLCLQRNYAQAQSVSDAKTSNLLSLASGYNDDVLPASLSKQIPSFPVLINDGSMRGVLPLVRWLAQRVPYADNSIIFENGRAYIAVSTISSSFSTGQILMRVM